MAKWNPIQFNNPLNIRISDKNAWRGKDVPSRDPRGQMETFGTAVDGLRAGAVLMIAHYDRKGADTIEKMVTTWAPPKGKANGKTYSNPTKEYIDAVAQWSGFRARQMLNFHNYDEIKPVLLAMAQFETGKRDVYSDLTVDTALRDAGVKLPQKPLSKSREIRGAQVAAASTVVGTGTLLSDLWDQLDPFMPMFDRIVYVAPKVAIGLLVLAPIGYMVWARIQRHREGS